MSTVDFYKDKIEEMRHEFPDQLFSDNSENFTSEITTDEASGETWQHRKTLTRKETLKE